VSARAPDIFDIIFVLFGAALGNLVGINRRLGLLADEVGGVVLAAGQDLGIILV
jgi:hypothetical protein